jgi:hypothetical protein
MQVRLLILLLLPTLCLSQTKMVYTQTGSMQTNGRQNEWRWIEVPIAPVVDTIVIPKDSALSASQFKIGNKLYWVKETPKAKDTTTASLWYNRSTGLLSFQLDTTYTYNSNWNHVYHRKVHITKTKYKPVKVKSKKKIYFIGSGEVIERYDNYILIRVIKGSYK